MLLRSLMFMTWRRDLGTDSTARSLLANAVLASSRVGHVEPYSMHRARSDSRRYYILVPERPRDDDRREYDETDRVDPGIIRGLVLALRGNVDIFSRVNTIGINRPVVRLRRITMERR